MNLRSKRILLIVLTSLLTPMLSKSLAFAQVSGATLSGTVSDPQGGVIPKAAITITDAANGLAQTVLSDGVGAYSAPNVIAGKYQVTASAPGFKSEVVRGLVLTVGSQKTLNIVLQVGATTEQVEVTTTASTVDLSSSSLGGVVDPTTVRELPLNGRSWSDLAALQPGVVATTTQSSSYNLRGNRGYANSMSISGARPQQNNYRLDGTSINDYTNTAGSVLGGNLGVDGIQEFSVITTSYSAEYGRTAGGVINAVTRSGTNTLHGNVYAFFRNDKADAENYFDTAKNPFHRFQFGGSVGAPIQKNKTFIFGDFEGIRQAKGITTVSFVPSDAARAGNLSTGTVTVDPYVQKFLGFYPHSNGAILAPGDVGTFSLAGNYVVTENYAMSRLDHKFSDRDSMFGTYQFDRSNANNPDAFKNILLGYLEQRQVVVLEERHTFNSSVENNVRFGFNRDYVDSNQNVTALNPLSADLTLGANGQYAPSATIGGGVTAVNAGLGSTTSAHYRWNSFQGYDDAFVTKGHHFLKFGVAYERDQLNQQSKLGSVTGGFTFTTLSTFLQNKPSKLTETLPQFLPEEGTRQSILGLYVQDDWHVFRPLTINLGLRYEMATSPVEVNGKIANLRDLTDASPTLGNPYFSNPTLKNFEPRVGFAYSPFSNDKTVLRGAFGVYDALPMLYELANLNGSSYPYVETLSTSTLAQGSFPGGAAATPSSFTYLYVSSHPKRNYVLQYNLNVQHQLMRDLVATVGFVGSRGLHNAFRNDSADMVLPTSTSAGYVWPSPIGSGTRINTNTGGFKYLDWSGDSYYDALQVGVAKSLSRGFQLQGSYTWGKSIDTGSSVVTGDQYLNSVAELPFFDMQLRRGLSDYNVGRTLVLSGLWIASGHHEGAKGVTLDGWELGLITTEKDGVPFTAIWGNGGDPLGMGSSTPIDVPNRLGGSGCTSLVNPGNPNGYIKTQCFAIPTAPSTAFYNTYCDPKKGTSPQCYNLLGNAGRNIMIGPGFSDVDLSLYKNNKIERISPTFNAQFRFEVFNVLNHPNFTPPAYGNNNNIFTTTGTANPTAGILTTTANDSREMQLALKILW